MKIKFRAKDYEWDIELIEGLKTVKAVIDALPIKSKAMRWRDEIYFETEVVVDEEENSKEVVELGDVAYWIPGNAICIFFGKTPISKGDEIKPASAVNVFGKIMGDLNKLKEVEEGDEVYLYTPSNDLN